MTPEYRCLLCWTTAADQIGNNRVLRRSGRDISSSISILKNSTRIICLFAKLLQIPDSQIATYLRYGHPSEWGKICVTCAPMVEQGEAIIRQITRMESDLEWIQGQLRDMVMVKREAEEGIDEGNLFVGVEVRNYLVAQEEDEEGRLGQEEEEEMEFEDVDPFGNLDSDLLEGGEILPEDYEIHGGDVSENSDSESDPEEDQDWEPSISAKEKEKKTKKKHNEESSASPIPIKVRTWPDCIRWRLSLTKKGAGCIPSLEDLVTTHSITSFPCSDCPLIFTELTPWEEHTCGQLGCSEKIGFKCDKCGHSIATKVRLEKHMIRMHCAQKSSWTCGPCGVFFSSVFSYTKHLDSPVDTEPEKELQKKCKSSAIQCMICRETPHSSKCFLPSQMALDLHIEIRHGISNMPYVCSYPSCGKSFAWPHGLDRHRTRVHEKKPDKQVSCGQCGKSFDVQQNLVCHMRNVHQSRAPGARRWVCSYPSCGKSFAWPHSLYRHRTRVHEKTPDKQVICDQCGKSFEVQQNLVCHMRNVHQSRAPGAKRWVCDICGKEMVSSAKLKRHKQIHIDPEDAPHLCTICGKRFRLHEYLNIHHRSHDPDRHLKYPQYMPKGKRNPKGPGVGVAGARIGRPPKNEGAKAVQLNTNSIQIVFKKY